ncbi:unnamed protein product [Brassica oleracea]
MAREIIVMRKLDHPNVVKLQGLITASLSSSLYLVFEYMDHDLVGLASIPGIKFSQPQALLSIDPEQRGSAAIVLETEELYFRTEPFACDPSSLPEYPPSKEIDAKIRDEAKRQQRSAQEKKDSLTRRSHERKLIPPVKANPSLTAAMENPYLRRCVPGHSTRQMQITKDMTFIF